MQLAPLYFRSSEQLRTIPFSLDGMDGVMHNAATILNIYKSFIDVCVMVFF